MRVSFVMPSNEAIPYKEANYVDRSPARFI